VWQYAFCMAIGKRRPEAIRSHLSSERTQRRPLWRFRGLHRKAVVYFQQLVGFVRQQSFFSDSVRVGRKIVFERELGSEIGDGRRVCQKNPRADAVTAAVAGGVGSSLSGDRSARLSAIGARDGGAAFAGNTTGGGAGRDCQLLGGMLN
jgi:hypothetical protein